MGGERGVFGSGAPAHHISEVHAGQLSGRLACGGQEGEASKEGEQAKEQGESASETRGQVMTRDNGRKGFKSARRREVEALIVSGMRQVDVAAKMGMHKQQVNEIVKEMSHKYEFVPLRGERCPSSKLTEQDVMDMRKLYIGGVRASELAKRYGIDHSTARSALLGESWGHVPGALDEVTFSKGNSVSGSSNPNSVLSECNVREARVLFSKGHRISNLARKYGVSRRAMSNVVHGRSWKHVLTTEGKERSLREAK